MNLLSPKPPENDSSYSPPAKVSPASLSSFIIYPPKTHHPPPPIRLNADPSNADDANETDDDVTLGYCSSTLPQTQTHPEMHADFTVKEKQNERHREKSPSNRNGTGDGMLCPFSCFFDCVVIR